MLRGLVGVGVSGNQNRKLEDCGFEVPVELCYSLSAQRHRPLTHRSLSAQTTDLLEPSGTTQNHSNPLLNNLVIQGDG